MTPSNRRNLHARSVAGAVALAAGGLVHADSRITVVELDANFYATTGCLNQTYAWSLAHASAIHAWHSGGCFEDWIGSDSDTEFDPASDSSDLSTNASAGAAIGTYDHRGWWVEVDALASTGYNGCGEISVYALTFVKEEVDSPDCRALNGAVAVASPGVVFDPDGAWTGTIGLNVSASVDFSASGWPRRISGYVGDISEGTSSTPIELLAIYAENGSEGLGMSSDGNGGYQATLNVSGSGTAVDFDAVQVDFDDAWFDMDADGRFSQKDVDALNTLVGTGGASDPDLVNRFDFNYSGDVDAYDVAVLQKIIDAGAGSGLLGDYDGDGDTDCDDLCAMGSGWNYVIGDGNYRVEVDADLDGDNDSSDYAAVYNLLQPADINNDGAVDSSDVSDYLNLYNAQDPRADMNGDGVVNTQDWTLFLNFWNNPCSC
jgi:hypothetical protein